MTISNSKLKHILNKPQLKRFDLADRNGLAAKVSDHDRITFQNRYRFNQKLKRLALGRFPDMTLSQARNKVPELRKAGKDPLGN